MLVRSQTYQQPPSKVLTIMLNKTSYFADEYIGGKIAISLSTQTILNDVFITFNLIENWRSKGNDNMDISDINNKCLLTMYLEIKKQLKIDTDLVSLAPGKFTFPFLFKIPKDIICSFEYSTSITKASIRYSLSAQVISPYVQGTTSSYILIKSRPVMQRKDFKFSTSHNIHQWGLFKKGSTGLNITLMDNKDSFTIGETINFNVEVDNTNGKLEAKECKITLIRNLILKSKYGKVVKEFKDDALSKTFNTITKTKEKKSFCFSLQLKNFNNTMFNFNSIQLPYINISDLNYFIPSVNSSLIECKYTLKGTLYFNTFVKYDDRPRIMIPIHICHQSVDEYYKEFQNYYNSQMFNNQYNNINQINNYQIINNNNQINMSQQPLYRNGSLMDNNYQNPLLNNQNIGEEDNLDLPSQSEIEKPNNNEVENLGAPTFDAPAPYFSNP